MEGERQVSGAGTDAGSEAAPHRWSIAVDFDGVIHQHISPWIGDPCHIPDPPVPGAIAWLQEMVEHYDIFIFTCRLLTPRRSPVERAMCAWLAEHGCAESVIRALHFVSEKPHAGIYLDDRAVRFEGTFPTGAAIDAAAVPWNKRPETEAPEPPDNPPCPLCFRLTAVPLMLDSRRGSTTDPRAMYCGACGHIWRELDLDNCAQAWRAGCSWHERTSRPLPDDIGELLTLNSPALRTPASAPVVRCAECQREILPDTCACGASMDEPHDGHDARPMDCDCGRVTVDQVNRVLASDGKPFF